MSPPALVPIPIQTIWLIEFFTKCTEPSPKPTLEPPGCQLRVAFHADGSEVMTTSQSSKEMLGVK